MLKKIISYLLYIVVIAYILLAPYYLNNIFSEKYLESDQENNWSGVITMWDIPRYTINGSEFGWIQGRIEEYNKLHPDVYIDLRELHYNDNKDFAFQGALREDHPDIMPLYVDGEMIPLDNVLPIAFLNSEDPLQSINPEILSTLKKGSDVLGVPVYYSVNLLIINKDLLTNLGIKVPQSFTMDNFITLLNEVNEKDIKNEIIPFDFYTEQGTYTYMPFLVNENNTIFSQTGGNLYNNVIIEGLNKINLIKSSIVNLPADFGTRSRSDVITDFVNNKKTVVIAGNLNDVASVIRKQKSNKGFEFEIIPYFHDNGSHKIFADNVEAYAMMDTGDKKKQKAIENFLQFLLEEKAQNTIEIMGKIPAVDSNTYDFQNYKYLNDLISITKNGTSLETIPFYENKNSIDEQLNSEIKKYFGENQPSTETLYELQKSIDKLIDK